MKDKKELMQNLVASVTVSFVALSLGAAFGLLSGRGAFAGMISAGIIAAITSALGGTRIQCSGPTGPMTAVIAVIVATAFDQFLAKFPGGSPEHFINTTILLSGAILMLFGLLRLGKFINLIPNTVISGFMNGIAIIIWLDQIKKIFGLGGAKIIGGVMFENALLALTSATLVFGLPYLTKKYLPKYASLLSATLVTIIMMTAIAYFFHLNVEHVQLNSSLKSLGDLEMLIKNNIPWAVSWKEILFALPLALQLAVLGYLDTLMTSLVIDKMTNEKTKANKELVGQGVANGIVSLVGGIPGAQATIRSVLIVKEKATLRLAGVLVGVFALIEMIVFQDLINLIPQAVFAGILVKVGYDVFDWLPLKIYLKNLSVKPLKMLNNFFSRHDDEGIFVTNREMILIIGTSLLTVFWNLNVAVGLFTVLFYLHNFVFNKKNPMRDLKPITETESFAEEA